MGKLEDLTGLRSGRLTAISISGKDKYGRTLWHCKCDCGNECDVAATLLTHQKVKSCGCLLKDLCRSKSKNIAGNKYGMLTAIEPTDKRIGGSVVWRCRCDCGNEKLVLVSNLLSGSTTSCGCLQRGYDLTGQRFGKLTVLYKSKKDKSGNTYWHCKCDCGVEKDIRTQSLVGGITKSCGLIGCGNSEGNRGRRIKELAPGSVYGRLTVIRKTDKRFRGQVVWECRCECGNVCEVPSYSLKSGNTKSCGCLPAGRKANVGKYYVVYLSPEIDPNQYADDAGYWTGEEYYYDYYMQAVLVKRPEDAKAYTDENEAESALESCLQRNFENVLSGKVEKVEKQ